MKGQSFSRTERDKLCNTFCIILADGQRVYRHVCDDCPDCDDSYETDYFTDELGNKISSPDLTGATGCKQGDCYKSSTRYTLVDNTRTSFAWTAQIELTLTNDTVRTVTQTPTANFTQQTLQWSSLFSQVLSAAGCSEFTSEVRFNPKPYNLIDFSGASAPDGLLFPPSDLAGNISNIIARYVQIQACPTCPTIRSARVISVNGTVLEKPIDMVVVFVDGPVKKYELCKECGKEGKLYYFNTDEEVLPQDQPVCLFECDEDIPVKPDASCTPTTVNACDQGNIDPVSGDATEFFRRFLTCEDGSTDVYDFIVDVNGDIQDYTPVGPVDNCSGEIVEEPTEECQDTYDVCEVGGSGGFDLTDTNFICSKVGFTMDNAFTSVCPDGWTAQDLVDRLNAGNPTGSTWQVTSGNVIDVVDGEAPEFIHFFQSGGGQVTIYPGGSSEEFCAKRVKDCNSDKQTELLQQIADNTCPSSVTSNVVCSSTAQTVALENGGTIGLVAGQELLVGEVYDCNGNLQSFNISVLVAGDLLTISDPVDTGTCPSPSETIPRGCIKDEKGQEWDVYETTLNGNTVTYYQDAITGETGTPSGSPSSWTECKESTVLSIPTTTVDQWHNESSYLNDIEAHPVAFPEGYIPSMYLPGQIVTYYKGNGVYDGPNAANYGAVDTNQGAGATKVWFPESAVLPTEVFNDISLDIPTISVVDFLSGTLDSQDSDVDALINNNYTLDIEALPVGVPAGTYLPVRLGLNTQEYYQGNGNTSITNALRVALPQSSVVKTEEQELPCSPNHRDTDVDGVVTIPAGVKSFSILITDPNGPDVQVTMSGVTRSVPAQVGSMYFDHLTDSPVVVDPNGNRAYIVYAS